MANLTELNVEGVWCCQWICQQIEKRLPYLQRLRVINPVDQAAETSTDISNSWIDKTKLEVPDFSGNKHMKTLPASLSKASRLQELVVNGCSGLENVVLANSSLKSFSFIDPLSEALTPKILSLKGCTQLEKLMLHGLCYIVELDLSGCAIKVLDLKAMKVTYLRRLFLLGCEHLYRITRVSWLQFVCIDTRPGKLVRPSLELQPGRSHVMQMTAIIADARLARSLWDLAHDTYTVHIYTSISPLRPHMVGHFNQKQQGRS